MIDLLDVMEKVKSIAVKTGKMQKENLGRTNLRVETKSTGIDLVTEIDKASEKAIIEYLSAHYPKHRILSEEAGAINNDSEYLWIIDPLDGTTNYSQGLPIFAISIALQYKNETVLGLVYTPVIEQMFTGIKGQGAYLNGVKLQVSPKTELIDCVLATGFPYDIASHQLNNINYFSEIILKTRAIRRMGAAAYDLACVAAGKFDGYWEMNLQPWDAAAAMLLIEEAGGQIIHFQQNRGISIIAGNSSICAKIHEEIKKIDGRD